MRIIAFGAVAVCLHVGVAFAAPIQLDATASGTNVSGGTDTIRVTATFEDSTAAGPALSTGHSFPSSALLSATIDWTIGGASSSFSYDPGGASTSATITQTENNSFGLGQQIFGFNFSCVGSFCAPFPFEANLHIRPESATINNVLWDSTDQFLENALGAAASDFSNYLTTNNGAGSSYLRVGGTYLTLASVGWSDPNATGPDPDPVPNPVPLPAGLPMLLAGIAALGAMKRRANQRRPLGNAPVI